MLLLHLVQVLGERLGLGIVRVEADQLLLELLALVLRIAHNSQFRTRDQLARASEGFTAPTVRPWPRTGTVARSSTLLTSTPSRLSTATMTTARARDEPSAIFSATPSPVGRPTA